MSGTGGGDPREAKRDLRARIRAARRDRTPEEQTRLAQAMAVVALADPTIASARCIALYASVPGEPGTQPLRALLRERGIRILLPVVLDDLNLDWAEDGDALLETAHLGGPEPDGPRLGPEAIRQADVVLAPGLAVDTAGSRLGQGGGCYDRALTRLDGGAALVFAVVHPDEVLDAEDDPVPGEPHDRRVDGALTATAVLRFGL